MKITQTLPNLQTASTARPAAPEAPKAQEAGNEPRETVSISVPKVSIDLSKIGNAAYKGARSIPGVVSLALNAPVVTVAPLLNAIDPATSNGKAIAYERWSNVLGSTAIGTAAGAALGAVAGNAWAGAGLGVIGGFVAGGARSLLTPLWSPSVSVGYYRSQEAAKYPEIGNNAANSDTHSRTKSHAFGARLRAGYSTAFKEAFEDGGRGLDNLANFTRGLAGKPDLS